MKEARSFAVVEVAAGTVSCFPVLVSEATKLQKVTTVNYNY